MAKLKYRISKWPSSRMRTSEARRSHVAQYDPRKAAGERLAKKWRNVSEVARAGVWREVTEIPIAGQAFALRALCKIYDRLISRGNAVGVAAVLEQAVKEAGGAFAKRAHGHRRRPDRTENGGGR